MIGLTSQQVQEMHRRGKVNIQTDHSAKTSKDIVKENVFTYFNAIFVVLAVLCIAAGTFKSLTFLFVVVINTAIGIIQELHAKKVLDELSLMNEQHAIVVRDNTKLKIPVSALVLGDAVYLTAGRQIPADAVVIAGSVSVNEALLTGEADEIEKKVGDALMSGSFVVTGECYAQLTRVGDESYINQLMLKAKKTKKGEQSEMIRAINRLVKIAGIAIIPVGIALLYQSYVVSGLTFRSSVESMVAALIGMIPEGMYLLVSVALALSAALLASKKVMLHDMKSTEMLARVDVLCVDKTGTITDNSMLVAEVLPVKVMTEEESLQNQEWIRRYCWATTDDNQSMEALRRYYPQKIRERPKACIPFSSAYKYGCVAFEEGQFLLGAPEAVLGVKYEDYRARIESYAATGMRVMVFAKYAGKEPIEKGVKLTEKNPVDPLFFILLQNPLRENAVDTFAYFKEQDVQVKVISGDHALTVSEVAKKAGIPDADRYIDASTLRTDADLERAAEEYTVFGRTTPEQKQKLIRAIHNNGHTVAMTGDGVNDILAMKSADCSIAMAAGSDAAAQAAQVVLLDSDFSHMPQIVSEGRKTVNNIQRSSTLFLVKNIFSLLLSIFSIVSVNAYPLEPTQVSLISTFNIGIPAFLLSIEPNNNRIEGRFLAKVIIRAMPAALTNFFVIAALVVFGNTFGVDSTDISVAATFLMAIIGFMIVYRLSRPMNKYHLAVMLICIGGFVFCCSFLRGLFSIYSISMECMMLLVLFAIATEPLMRYLTILFEWIEGKLSGFLAGQKKR